MASGRDRQRAAARARLEREMARRAELARKRRRTQVAIGSAAAALLLVVGLIWIVVATTGDDGGEEATDTIPISTPGPCVYSDIMDGASASPDASATDASPASDASPDPTPSSPRTDVGKPEPGTEPREGVRNLDLHTNLGVITIQLDLEQAPCNSQSLVYLANQNFYDGSTCHRLITNGLYALQCGDPTGTGSGGPTYTTNDENLPYGQLPAYPRGVVAMANSGPNTNGSQFFIVYQDTSGLDPAYTIVGEVVAGLEIVEQVAAAGHDGAYEPSPGGGRPNQPLTIESVTVGEPMERPAPVYTSASPSPSPAESATTDPSAASDPNATAAA